MADDRRSCLFLLLFKLLLLRVLPIFADRPPPPYINLLSAVLHMHTTPLFDRIESW